MILDTSTGDTASGPPQPPESGFRAKIRHLSAGIFLSWLAIFTIPSILSIFPIGLFFGVYTAIQSIFGWKNRKIGEKIDKSEDSGISDASEASDDESQQISTNFEFQSISGKLKQLKITENLEKSIIDYLALCQKLPVLVTLRDVTEFQIFAQKSEVPLRIQYKKRKLKILRISENLKQFFTKMLGNSTSGTHLIYFFGAKSKIYENFENLTENRRFCAEIKEIYAENGENRGILEKSAEEILVVNKMGVVWVNSGF
ncbi:uncharacterized protein CELE_Y39B6A.10 [Caenorhabditis elegans]|uniref:Uncharacterized protein n=1 Tax=Caenorhabditis elegans TaxID=6239 RepID=Q9NET7_CAEEL|nr:Uncharacterized protein CELE_Y39B6A.10 [Caenorhabditis elegans]CAC51067.1 Uncharacterized protein CELE_Y39B6A.10 [Caenorhabditis elegans]|eukprot:NP_741688.1 Uncharacterized protein CELE_Y39B6A.10 [Caenorhabditis elegans]